MADLLNALRQGKKEEEPYKQPEIELDLVRKVAALFARDGVEDLEGELDLSRLDIYDQQGDEYIIKLIMLDNAMRVTGDPNYSLEQTLTELCLEIAGGVYSDVFDVMKQIYVCEIDGEDPEQPAERQHFDIIEYMKGSPIKSAIAARKIARYLTGTEKRIAYVQEPEDLKMLIGIKQYMDIIQDEGLSADVKNKMEDPKYSLEDVFVYSIMTLHKEFIQRMEGL